MRAGKGFLGDNYSTPITRANMYDLDDHGFRYTYYTYAGE